VQNQIVRDGFFFLGGHPVLDFLNTKPVQKGQARELLKDFSALLRWFSAAGLMDRTAAAKAASQWRNIPQSDVALARILSFRESMRSAILALESRRKISHGVIDEVNDLLRQHPVTFQVVKAGHRLIKRLEQSPRKTEDLLGILANLAAGLLSEIDPLRIRKCESCVLHFCDTTKNRTRRWCSMKICGNRAKVASFAARQRRFGTDGSGRPAR
jgi:predicted RNA-binding Zn ribbon-like protein